MSDAEQRDVMQIGLVQLARWSSVVGILVVAGHIGAFILMEQWQMLALAGMGAAIVVLWSLAPRIAESDFELGVVSYSTGIYLAALAVGLLVRGAPVVALLALAVLVTVLLLGRQAGAMALLSAVALLGGLAGLDRLLPWERTDYGGYLTIVQALANAGVLVGLGVLVGQVSTRWHSLLDESSIMHRMAEGLAQRVERLTAQQKIGLRTANDIAWITAAAADEDQLLEPVANMLRERYALTNVMIYMVSAEGDYASLRLMTGRARAVRTSALDAIPVGAEMPVGQAMERLEVVTREKPEGAAGRDAYAELAAPMVVEGKLLGILLLQCSERDRFSSEQTDALAVAADQLALALAHVRQHMESATRVEPRYPRVAVSMKPVQVGAEPLVEEMASLDLAIESPAEHDDMLIAPIAMQGQVVGTLGFREEDLRRLTSEEMALVQAVADQVAQAVENLNLLESTERAALREQLVNDVTVQLQRSTSVDEVLQTAAQALQRVLEGYEVSIRLSPEALGIGRPLAAPSAMRDNEGGESHREEE